MSCFGAKALEIGDDDDTARSKRLVGVAACSSQMTWIDRFQPKPTSNRRDPLLSDPLGLILLWGLKCEGVHCGLCVIIVKLQIKLRV